ncbi:hypothetical protein [Microbacterium dauci]|uniref:Uncharacterized protein n=1 Tax=Microbacterium dauci TaxID=3048008 RepID=A0ABT6ZH09_9MICO|nr:hypothetical protein [Microbacterium sp. LX3-4]MDJ1115430.1 hypothetical protein [Microbacterium sp. LX3-4]
MSVGAVSVSPRTAAEPMAFTGAEFRRGATEAWGWYLLSVVVCSVMYGLIAIPIALLWATPVSLAATLVWAPIAYALGLALRRTRAIAVHLAAFTLLGGVAGVVTMLLFLAATGDIDMANGWLWLYGPFALTPTLAVPFAWWRTARRALRSDRGEVPIKRDPDAAAEDASVIRLTERTDEFDAR